MVHPIISLLRRMARPAPRAPEDRAGLAALLTLLSVIFMNLVGFGIVIPLLPFYAQSFDAPAWQIALLFSAYSLGAFFGEPFWGRMSDRIGRKPLLISTVLGTCLCYGTLAFAPNIYVAFFVRLLGGLASGNGSVIQGYIADVTPPAQRSGRLALLGAAFNIGFIVGPAIGGLLAHPELGPIGFRLPLLVASGLGLCSVVGVIFFVKESRRPDPATFVQPSRWAMLGFSLKDPVVSRMILLTFLSGFAFTGIESVFGLWGQARFDWGPREIGLMFGATGIIAAICQMLLTGPVSRYFGEARTLAGGMAVAVLASFLQIFSTGVTMSTVLLMLSALGNSLAWPNASALISRVTDPDHQGQVMGINNATGAIARVAGPLAAGIVFASVAVNGPFILAALIVAPAIFLAIAAGRAAEKYPQTYDQNYEGRGH